MFVGICQILLATGHFQRLAVVLVHSLLFVLAVVAVVAVVN